MLAKEKPYDELAICRVKFPDGEEKDIYIEELPFKFPKDTIVTWINPAVSH